MQGQGKFVFYFLFAQSGTKSFGTVKANSQILGASTSLRRLQLSISNFHIFLKLIHRRSPLLQLSIWFPNSESSSGRSWLAYQMLRSLSKTYERRLDWIPGLLREEAKIKTDILGLNIWDIWEYMEIYRIANWIYWMLNWPNSKSVVLDTHLCADYIFAKETFASCNNDPSSRE